MLEVLESQMNLYLWMDGWFDGIVKAGIRDGFRSFCGRDGKKERGKFQGVLMEKIGLF